MLATTISHKNCLEGLAPYHDPHAQADASESAALHLHLMCNGFLFSKHTPVKELRGNAQFVSKWHTVFHCLLFTYGVAKCVGWLACSASPLWDKLLQKVEDRHRAVQAFCAAT